MLRTLWDENGKVYIIDQTLLPGDLVISEIGTVDEMWDAIKRLRVRGAPAIGIAAAYGVWLGVRDLTEEDDVFAIARQYCDYLASSRPTAVNLFGALERMRRVLQEAEDEHLSLEEIQTDVLAEAQLLVEEDLEICRAIGKNGASLLRDGMSILTHCNAGGLATAGLGTALAPVYWATREEGKRLHVFADETRPLLQGARLTAWELQQAEISTTLICDNMAAMVMKQGLVSAVFVGTDRVAANGDTANKIGTYGLSIIARHHNIPFYVAAPTSSIDMSIATGADIPIEERDADEVRFFGNQLVAPEDIDVYNPAFDVTPSGMISAFVTEKGIVYPPYSENLLSITSEE
ncbi:MAG: S-methyl-5-thioribose-1-phosphate isomerase [Candidatus Sumerlaeales bacterium]|nr:S-methyl-5-thioribose-1-phosphate isomerase [Candidatus Sumerlaeales bacterium]